MQSRQYMRHESMNKSPFALALITGASSGIGESLAKLLASKGIHLILCGRNEERLKKLASELSVHGSVTSLIADLSEEAGRKKIVSMIHEKAPDLVINNAGYGFYGEALAAETKEMLKLMEVNGMAVLELSLEAARTLISREKKGVILNVSSAAAFQIFPYFAVYAASKAFVNSFTESFDEEVREYGVRVLAACPGMVATNFRVHAGETEKEERSTNVMSSAFAAEHIWDQIEKRKKIYIFNWPYRAMTFLTQHLLPKWLVAAILPKTILKRLAKKEIIKLPHV